jgi:hypothetical protein
LAISGDDVVALLIERHVLPAGSKGGPEVGFVLQRLLDDVTERPQLNEPEELRRAARRVIEHNFTH